jgi:hypothetical protein
MGSHQKIVHEIDEKFGVGPSQKQIKSGKLNGILPPCRIDKKEGEAIVTTAGKDFLA